MESLNAQFGEYEFLAPEFANGFVAQLNESRREAQEALDRTQRAGPSTDYHDPLILATNLRNLDIGLSATCLDRVGISGQIDGPVPFSNLEHWEGV